MELLLLSNSTLPGEPFLQWPTPLITEFVGSKQRVLFLPYAGVGVSFETYLGRVQNALSELQLAIPESFASFSAALEWSDVIMVGGGNSFALLDYLQKKEQLPLIQKAVKQGMPFIGWSAGANIAGPSIKTTNDMPIVGPNSLEAVNGFPIQINPHYTEKTIPNHGGESRLLRLQEFVAYNKQPVLCIPEGTGIVANSKGFILKSVVEDACKLLKSDGEVELLSVAKHYRYSAL